MIEAVQSTVSSACCRRCRHPLRDSMEHQKSNTQPHTAVHTFGASACGLASVGTWQGR